jgi:hypothetical protein
MDEIGFTFIAWSPKFVNTKYFYDTSRYLNMTVADASYVGGTLHLSSAYTLCGFFLNNFFKCMHSRLSAYTVFVTSYRINLTTYKIKKTNHICTASPSVRIQNLLRPPLPAGDH